MDNPSNNMKSKALALTAILASLSVGTNYAMISLYNVKLMDLIVFVGGFCFGPLVGTSIAVISWAVYGTLNPLGFSLPIWLSTMLSETLYGFAGGLLRRGVKPNSMELKRQALNLCVFFGAVGAMLTIAYDVVTNVVFGYVNGLNVLFAVIIGFVPFGLVHMISNTFFFGIGCLPAIRVMLRIIGGDKSGSVQE